MNRSTTDIMFAAYLKLKGYNLVNFEVISRGKGRYIFDISEEIWKAERINFFSSEISKIKQIMEELKDLLY